MNGWNQQRKDRQAQLIQQWKPWTQSTGPKTVEGKSKVSQNSYKGAVRENLRALSRVLGENEMRLAQIDSYLQPTESLATTHTVAGSRIVLWASLCRREVQFLQS